MGASASMDDASSLRGRGCPAAPGTVQPVVDFRRCEGKRDCVEVCPFDVFEVRRMDDADFAVLGWIGRVKQVVHGRQVAYTPRVDACRACGFCVDACPERAITLIESIAP